MLCAFCPPTIWATALGFRIASGQNVQSMRVTRSDPQTGLDFIRKILVSVKIFVRNSGAGNGCANFMDAWKNAFFLQEKPMSIKFLVLGGGVFWVFFGGGGGRYYFYGRADFSDFTFSRNSKWPNRTGNPAVLHCRSTVCRTTFPACSTITVAALKGGVALQVASWGSCCGTGGGVAALSPVVLQFKNL